MNLEASVYISKSRGSNIVSVQCANNNQSHMVGVTVFQCAGNNSIF